MNQNRPAANRLDAILQHPLILPLYLPALLLSVAQGVILPVLPLYAGAFDAPYLWIGLVLAGDGLGLLIGDLPAGVLLRRIDRRMGMLAGIVLVGLATMALYWAQSIEAALALRVLSGLGTGLYSVARHTYVADTIHIANRGRSVALLGGTFRAGRMLGPLIGGAVAAGWGLRASFLVYALVCGLAALAIAGFSSRGAAGPAPVERSPITFGSILVTFRRQAARLLAPGTGLVLMQVVRAGPATLIPLYGALVLGLDVQQIGLVLALASGVDMLLFYPTGIVMDRLGRKWSVVPSALIQAAGLAMVPFAEGFLGLTLAAMLNGLGNGLGSGVMITIGADLTPAESRGEFLGIWNLLADAGNAGGPVLAGAVADMLALQPAAWVIASAGLGCALVFGFGVPETLKK